MTIELKPLPGFDWAKVAWGAPDAPAADWCSYCSETIPEDTVPLILWDGGGASARFCDACMAKWWGMR